MRYWFIALGLTLTVPMARVANAVDDWTAGKKLYTAKCARCHKFYDPAEYNADKWNTWMEKMRRKARLNDEQYKSLFGYLQSVRTDALRKIDAPKQ